VSDRETGWEHNYRCPDVVVYLAGTRAKSCDTHWRGGPDFAVEIVSDYDRTRDKIEFYAAVGTRELLIVDRDPWCLELLRLDGNELKSVGTATERAAAGITSAVLPLTYHLAAGADRPVLKVTRPTDGKTWDV
jgi:Uma2 family endonuclease